MGRGSFSWDEAREERARAQAEMDGLRGKLQAAVQEATLSQGEMSAKLQASVWRRAQGMLVEVVGRWRGGVLARVVLRWAVAMREGRAAEQAAASRPRD